MPDRDRHTQLWLPFLPCVLRYLVTHEAVHLAILKSFVEDKKIQVVGGIYQLRSGRVELLT
jgi:hypothetical protein